MTSATSNVIYITGGTGFIGSALAAAWIQMSPNNQVWVQTRSPRKYHDTDQVRYVSAIDQCSDIDLAAIVNLAGAPIADRRWSKARKKVLEASRVELTSRLLSASENHKPQAVISASAIGYYGLGDQCVDESGIKGRGYAAELCKMWEDQAQPFADKSRLVVLRLGVVLGRHGMLKKLLPMYQFGMGGPIASGSQWLSWVHLSDVVAGIICAINDSSYSGVYNLTSPEPVKQSNFARSLSAALRRPCFVTTPGWALSAVFGQMAHELLIGGQRIVPDRLRQAGFQFQYPELESALSNILQA